MKTLVFIVLLLLAASCNLSDDYHELGSGFHYVGEGGTDHYIRGGDVGHNSLIYGNVLKYNADDEFIIAEQEPSREDYRSKLASHIGTKYYQYQAFSTDSAAWKQDWPAETVREVRNFAPLYKILQAQQASFENTQADIMKCEALADSLLQHQPYYQQLFSRKRNYWIIDKRTTRGYGPYDAAGFARECKRLNISLRLKAHY